MTRTPAGRSLAQARAAAADAWSEYVAASRPDVAAAARARYRRACERVALLTAEPSDAAA